MEIYKLDLTEDSRPVYTSVHGTRLNCVNDAVYNLRSNGFEPLKSNSICISMKQMYIDQFGKLVPKYKNNKYSFFKYFVIYCDQFSIDVLESEMINRFIKN